MFVTFGSAIALAFAASAQFNTPGLLVLASMVLFRMAMAACTSWMTGDRLVQRYLWCLPLSDLLSFAIYIASYLGNTIVWRGETFKLLPGGKMVRIGSER